MTTNTQQKPQVITFGCRLNRYESDMISTIAPASTNDKPVIVFNSCTVTKEAERQVRQSIRKTKRKNPNAHIIVTGCAAQVNPDQFAKMEEVNLVLGNEEKLEATSYASLKETDDKVQVQDIMQIESIPAKEIVSVEGRARAYMQVQNGCNHRCTFCIIPYGRGNSRSVPVGEVFAHVSRLVQNGYKEIVFTGVDISDYGHDLPGQPSLGQMCRRILALTPDLPRLRLSSIDVAEVDEDILWLLENEPRFTPYFHLSLQSGDNMILKRMKRRHTREDVLDFCEKVRHLRPTVSFGADIITGFPTETDAMFENTLNLVEEAGIALLHVFPYSEREGTPAAKMPPVPMPIRKERATRLREAGQKQHQKLLQSWVGKQTTIVVEQDGISGKTESFLDVTLDEAQEPGALITCEIHKVSGDALLGSQTA